MTTDIAMFVHNSVSNDSRVLKEAASLAAHGWRVVVVGVDLTGSAAAAEETRDGFTIRRVIPRLLAGKSGSWVKLLRLTAALPAIARQLRRADARVYHANDFVGLLVMALAGIWRRPVVYDSHELFFDRFPVSYALRRPLLLLRPLEKMLARRAAAVITVSESLANHLSQTLSIQRPLVVQNAVDMCDLGAAVPVSRQGFQHLVIHSGNLANGRHLVELVDALRYLPENTALLLLGDGQLKSQLSQQAQQANVQHRLIFHPPVPIKQVSPTLAQADVAVVLTSPSYQIALPNKFFEAVAAGLPVVGTPLPEVKTLMERYDLGVLCDPTDPKAIASAVETILQPENNQRFRANALKARQELNWEREEKKLVALYQRLLEGTP